MEHSHNWSRKHTLRRIDSKCTNNLPLKLPIRTSTNEIHLKDVPSKHLPRWPSLHLNPPQTRNRRHKRTGKTGREMETSLGSQRDCPFSPLCPLRTQFGQPSKCRRSQNLQRKPSGIQKTSQKVNFLILIQIHLPKKLLKTHFSPLIQIYSF